MDDNKDFQFLEKIQSDYFETFGYKPFTVNITFSKDLYESYLANRPDLNGKLTNQFIGANGTIVPPATNDDIFTILISTEFFRNTVERGVFSWVETYIHELTHVKDLCDYDDLGGSQNYDESHYSEQHYMFRLWTEFNATRHGYYFLRKYTFNDINDESQISGILNNEFPGEVDRFFSEYNSAANQWEQIYSICQFLGIFTVWEDLFPHHFNINSISPIFNENRWMIEVYKFLNINRNLHNAVCRFDDLREILRDNFRGI